MSDPSSLLAPIRKRVVTYRDHGTPGLHAPQDRARLLAALDGVLALADDLDLRAVDGRFSSPAYAAAYRETSKRIRAAVVAALQEGQ